MTHCPPVCWIQRIGNNLLIVASALLGDGWGPLGLETCQMATVGATSTVHTGAILSLASSEHWEAFGSVMGELLGWDAWISASAALSLNKSDPERRAASLPYLGTFFSFLKKKKTKKTLGVSSASL